MQTEVYTLFLIFCVLLTWSMQTKDYKHFWVLDSGVHCVSTTFCPYRSTSHIVWMRLCSKSVQLMVCTIFGMYGMQDTRFRNPHQVSLLALLKCKQWKAPRAGLTRFETAVIFSYKEAPIPLLLIISLHVLQAYPILTTTTCGSQKDWRWSLRNMEENQ